MFGSFRVVGLQGFQGCRDFGGFRALSGGSADSRAEGMRIARFRVEGFELWAFRTWGFWGLVL